MICFLDRDGILNVDCGYVGSLERYTWNPEIYDILSYLKDTGYRFVLVTNQSGLARRYYSLSDFYDLSFYILNHLEETLSIRLEINFCPHHPNDCCRCRKPSPGMMLRYGIGPDDIMIGDSPTDMGAAYNAGISHRWLVSENPSGPYTHSFNRLSSLRRTLLQGQLIKPPPKPGQTESQIKHSLRS